MKEGGCDMKRVPFRSGVHPFDGKKFSRNKEIIKIDAAQTMVFPMSQHIGAPAIPTVKPGDRVLKGTLLGKAASAVSSPAIKFINVVFPH